jgi:NAD(P)-dependent dehydrogenase (short-subunit alcohol dehydrogenase family)
MWLAVPAEFAPPCGDLKSAVAAAGARLSLATHPNREEIPMSAGRVQGRVAVVTGAASGIGEGTARRLAEEGATVVVSDIDVDGGKRVVDEIRAAGGQAAFVRADMSKTAQIRRLIERSEKDHGRLEILVNNAIAFRHAPATQLDEKDWDLTLNVGLKAVFLAAKYGIPAMQRSGGGAIVNIASVHSLVSFAGATAYDAAKAGVLGLTRTLAIDYGPDVRVNAVLPGAILTPLWDKEKVPEKERRRYARMVPAQRMGTAQDIANAVLYLASDEASFVTGASITVDGGLLARTD